MLDYIEKYKKLPEKARDFISNESNMGKIESLEEEFSVDLAPLVIKVTVGDVKTEDVFDYLKDNFDVSETDCMRISQELSTSVFKPVYEILKKEESGKNEDEPTDKEERQDPSHPSASGRDSGQLEQERKKKFLPKFKKRKRLEAYDHDHKEEDIDLTQRKQSETYLQKNESDHFSQEDEEELNEIASRIDKESVKKKQNQNKQIEHSLLRIIKEVGIRFSSEETKERFRKIISTYLIGVRSRSKTRLTLSKEFDKGGLGLGEKIIDRILDISDKYAKGGERQSSQKEEKKKNEPNKGAAKKNEEGNANLDEPYFEKQKQEKKSIDLNRMPNRDIDYDLSALREKVKKVKEDIKKKKAEKMAAAEKDKGKNSEEEEKPEKPEKQEYDLSEVLRSNFSDKEEKKDEENKKQEEDRVGSEEKGKEKKIEQKRGDKKKEYDKGGFLKNFLSSEKKGKEQKDSVVTPEQNLRANKKVDRKKYESEEVNGKKKVDDIKKAPRLVNPINELKYMDLTSFRRLGRSAKERTEKIKEKINNLEKKYYYRKVQGIKAWRESPVNKTYVTMGRESIFHGKPIDDIIKQRKKEGKDFLNKEEFHAIMDLNDQLRKF